MIDVFNDSYSEKINEKMAEFETIIDDIECKVRSFMEEETKILEYLNDICYSMPLGLCIRRYLCLTFSKGFSEDTNTYSFYIDGEEISVGNYADEDYDITSDDIDSYVKIFMHINSKYNTTSKGELSLKMSVGEIKRMIRSTSACKRSTLFVLSFALHMTPVAVIEFLTKVLGEQSYNFRNPYEVIAYYCQSKEKLNNHMDYLRICSEYEKRISKASFSPKEQINYTLYAKANLAFNVTTEDDLYSFLVSNRANFNKFSQTAYVEFKTMYDEVMRIAKIQDLSNDSYLTPSWADSEKTRKDHEEKVNKAIHLHSVKNTEQLAKCMLYFIPRSTTEKFNKKGEKIITDDFIRMSNKNTDKKSQTTMLPKEITENLLTKDRLDDLLNGIKPVDRKALILLKFFIFSLKLEDMELSFYAENPYGEFKYSASHCLEFLNQCNDMLVRCGMAKLYPANRFDNLVLISLVSSKPYEMFGQIIENSFIHEPEALED